MRKTGIRAILTLVLTLVMVVGSVGIVEAAKPDRWTEVEITDVYFATLYWHYEAEYSYNDVGAWGWTATITTQSGLTYYKGGKFDGRTTSGTDIAFEYVPSSGGDLDSWVDVTLFLLKKNGNSIRKDYARATATRYYLN